MNKIKNTLVFLFVFQCFFLFSQQLEEQIYNAVDAFNNHQNQTSFQQLVIQEKQFQSHVSTTDEQLALVYLQCNKAYYLKQIGNSKEAIASYENAWQNYSKNNLKGYDIIEYCLKPLGNLYTISQDYTNAENTIRQYIFLAEKEKNQQQKIAGIINLSILYQSIGKHNDVLKLTSDALKAGEINQLQKQKLINIATNSKIALNKIENVQEIHSAKSNSYQYYLTISQFELKRGQLKLAMNSFEKANKLFFSQKNVTARMLAKLYVFEAQLYLKSDKTEEAKVSLFNAIHSLLPNSDANNIVKKDLYAENTFIDIFDLLGSVQDDTQKAMKYYDFSFYVSSLLNSNITSQEARIINQASNRNRSERCIRLLFDAYATSSEKKLLEKAFLYAEKSKSTVLKDIIRKKTLLELHPKDSLLLHEQQLLQKQELLTNNLINAQLSKSNSQLLNALSNQLSSVSVELKSVKESIENNYPNKEIGKLLMSDLMGKLSRDNAVLVEYFYGKRNIYQFVIDGKKSAFYQIELNKKNSNELKTFIHLFDNAAAINNDVKNYTDKAFQTYNLLNLMSVDANKNLLIIPDGLLNFIPFEALLTEKSTTNNYEKMPFLVRKQLVCYNSSAEFYLSGNSALNGKKTLGFFPIFRGSNKELRYSLDEAKALEKEMNMKLLKNDKATKAAFVKMIKNYNMLHLSTHANGGSFTQPAVIEFYDDVLPLNELYSLDLNADLVVLSACETGVGKLQRGEGAMSIARGFQYAGAKNILFSLWQINDKSTSEIMRLFYKNLNTYNSVSSANQLSKTEYLDDKSISNSKKSPYYWSAFVYYGNFTKPVAKPYNSYVLIGFGILVLGLFLFFKNKRGA